MADKYAEGVLRYNPENDRFGIWQDGEWYIDGLHCGMCFDVRLDGPEWVPVRLEYGDMPTRPEGWYLVGADGFGLEGRPCRWHVGW